MLNHRSITCGKCNGLFYVTLIVLLIYLSCCWQQKSTLNMIIHVGHIFYEYRTLSFIWKQSSNTQITYKADLSSTHLRNMTLKSVLICNNSRLPRKERKEASVSWHQRECEPIFLVLITDIHDTIYIILIYFQELSSKACQGRGVIMRGIFHTILSVPQNIVMDLNNVMLWQGCHMELFMV